MNKLWNTLGSPRNLIVFVAAAQGQSFTAAAQELRMRQPSVSAAIKQLETDLGITLFIRAHRKVTLTPQGHNLFDAASKALKDIETSIANLQAQERNRNVTLSSSSAFAHYWMVPRLHLLHAAHPDIDLRLQNSLREPDFDNEPIDLGIRLGDGAWSGLGAAKIADEAIFPVASPALLDRLEPMQDISDLLTQPLIHLEEPIRKRPSWQDWFAAHGRTMPPPQTRLRLNDYALVLQAAITGEGFAFGWEHQVRDLMAKGLLVGWPEWSWRTGKGFYLVWSDKRPLSRQAIFVRDWIIAASDYPKGSPI